MVWATRNPRLTYGNEPVDDILAVYREAEAVIWITPEGWPSLRLIYIGRSSKSTYVDVAAVG
jgi:hypothetical protein